MKGPEGRIIDWADGKATLVPNKEDSVSVIQFVEQLATNVSS